MNYREAKRKACDIAYQLLCNAHENEFLYEDWDNETDRLRFSKAWDELLEELNRRSFKNGRNTETD